MYLCNLLFDGCVLGLCIGIYVVIDVVGDVISIGEVGEDVFVFLCLVVVG